MKRNLKTRLTSWLPFIAGAVLVAQFVGLGVWQIRRGFEKIQHQQAFQSQAAYAGYSRGEAVKPYQRLKITGRFDNDHQVLLDNISLDSRNGYYVLTPFHSNDGAVLLVNRGWLEKRPSALTADDIAVATSPRTIRGRAGMLPRAFRLGPGIPVLGNWPQHAVSPTMDEVAGVLAAKIEPFGLLLDADESGGYARSWTPQEFGPARHFGYAFQWFAMAVALAALLIWHFRKRSFA